MKDPDDMISNFQDNLILARTAKARAASCYVVLNDSLGLPLLFWLVVSAPYQSSAISLSSSSYLISLNLPSVLASLRVHQHIP